MGQWIGIPQAGNIWYCRVCPHVEEHAVTFYQPDCSVVCLHLQPLRPDKSSLSHDQLNVTLLVAVQMHIHQAFHHLAFSPADRGHVDRRSRWETELRASPG